MSHTHRRERLRLAKPKNVVTMRSAIQDEVLPLPKQVLKLAGSSQPRQSAQRSAGLQSYATLIETHRDRMSNNKDEWNMACAVERGKEMMMMRFYSGAARLSLS